MSDTTTTNTENHLISLSPRRERDRILKTCEPIEITSGTVLCEPGQPHLHVYFPVTGLISQLKSVRKHPPMLMRLIGNEGMLGAKLVLGIDSAHLQSVVQAHGMVLRMTTNQFLRVMHNSPCFKIIIKHYLYVLMTELSQSIACSRFHEVNTRLARCLLLIHDRIIGDEFHLTHQYLAEMLGVQRSAVTIAAGELQHKRLIRYVRGDIRILNRRGLKTASCECYDAAIKDYNIIFS